MYAIRSYYGLLPELQFADIVAGGSGVRAQAVDAGGNLVDDFRIVETESMVHVLNAPSPAATASIRIGQTVADRITSYNVCYTKLLRSLTARAEVWTFPGCIWLRRC